MKGKIYLFIFLIQPRVVKLKRDPMCGLGLCVKGGKEHNLPLLISNMFKNQPGSCSVFL